MPESPEDRGGNLPSPSGSDLRRRAEQAVAARNRDCEAISYDRLQELVHELEVHQVELETQNESLRIAQSELEHSRDRYADLYDFAPVGYVTLNDRGTILESNLTAAQMLGVERGRLLGHPLVAFAHPAAKNRLIEHVQGCAKSREGEEQHSEILLQGKGSRSRMAVQLRSVVVLEPLTGERSYRTAMIDLSELRQSQQERRDAEENFAALADNMLQLAWMADATGWIFWYNRRWYAFTGMTPEAMENHGWQTVLHPDHRQRVQEKLRRHFEKGGEWEDTFLLRGQGGHYRWFLSRATPIMDSQGNVLRWFGTHTDITERSQMEERLREADRRKDEFLATLAHELRNPLAPIRTGLELLRMAPEDGELGREVFQILESQSAQLIRLVDDLLDVSRISRGIVELRKSEISLASVLENAIQTARRSLEAGTQRIELRLPDRPLRLNADETRLSQVFSNLLTNAIKYSDGAGCIRVEVVPCGDQVETRICDEGRGIAPEMLERIFGIFVQATPPFDRSQGGLGIGLTLCRSLVELHGGRIHAFSKGHGQGSEFIVRLPLLEDEPPPELPPPSTAEAASEPLLDSIRHRVLIVDDNRNAADMLGKLLATRGHEVRVAYGGQEGLDVGTEFQPDVVLLDLGMPGLNGFETARTIRQRAWGEHAYLVALSGWGQEQDRHRTNQAGFDAHLVKPVAQTDLHRLLTSRAEPRS